jgi:hypothetical protein
MYPSSNGRAEKCDASSSKSESSNIGKLVEIMSAEQEAKAKIEERALNLEERKELRLQGDSERARDQQQRDSEVQIKRAENEALKMNAEVSVLKIQAEANAKKTEAEADLFRAQAEKLRKDNESALEAAQSEAQFRRAQASQLEAQVRQVDAQAESNKRIQDMFLRMMEQQMSK